jgi:hypothetical protein
MNYTYQQDKYLMNHGDAVESSSTVPGTVSLSRKFSFPLIWVSRTVLFHQAPTPRNYFWRQITLDFIFLDLLFDVLPYCGPNPVWSSWRISSAARVS